MKSFSLTGWCPKGIPEGKAGGCNLKIFFGVVLVITLFLTYIAGATVPRLLTLQGRITDPTTGNPVADGTYMMVFGIYERESNGSPLWAETTSVPVQAGTFNVYLHPPDPYLPPDPIFNDTGVRYLGIQIPPDPQMTPRIRLASVPYSFKVRSVEGALGGNIFGDLQLHSTLTVGDLAGDVGKLEITDGASTKIVADGATGKVGIGTSTPDPFSFLHMKTSGSGNFDRLTIESPINSVGFGIEFKQPSRQWWVGQNIGNFSDGRFQIYDATAAAWRVTILNNGNVGIDHTAPEFKLDIGGGDKGLRVVGPSGPGTAVRVGGNGDFSIDAPGVPGGRFVVKDGGNVGIGTASPLNKLTVYDDNTVEYGLRVDKVATGGNSQAVSSFNSAAPAAGFASHGGFFKASSNVSTGIFTKKVGVRGQATGTGSDNIAGWFQASGATNNYAIYADLGKNYFADNVGIGTASPGNILTVVVNSATDPIADAWDTYSSAEYKQGIHELTDEEYSDALQKLLNTPVVKYRYKGQSFMDKEKIGIVIEEAPEEIIAEGNSKAASLNEYISLLHAGLKAQQNQIENQQTQIQKLEETINQLTKEELK